MNKTYTRHVLIQYSPEKIEIDYQIYIKSGPGTLKNLKYSTGSLEFDLILDRFTEEDTTLVYNLFPKSRTSKILTSEKVSDSIVTQVNSKGEIEIPTGIVSQKDSYSPIQSSVQVSGGNIVSGVLTSKSVSSEIGIKVFEQEVIDLEPIRIFVYLSKNPYYEPQIFLLQHDLDKELIQQTIEVFQYMLGVSPLILNEKAKELSKGEDSKQLLLDMLDKYKDMESLSEDAIRNKIKEQGFEYLLDVFSLSLNELKVLGSYLPLIQSLKGSYSGIELVLMLMGASELKITEWWEDPTNLEVLSYILSIEIVNKPVESKFISRLQRFSRQYVYPLLTQVLYSIRYDFSQSSPTPCIGCAVYTENELQVWEDFLWLTWASDDLPQNKWSDELPYQSFINNTTVWDSNSEDLIWAEQSENPESEENTESEKSENNWSDDILDFDVDDPNSQPKIRSWASPEKSEDEILLSWLIEKFGSISEEEAKKKLEELEKEFEQKIQNFEELWSTEDSEDERQIRTYWSPDEIIADGTNVEFSIAPIPFDAIVEINGEITYSAIVKKGRELSYKVYYIGEDQYYPQSGVVVPSKTTHLAITLEKIPPSRTLTIRAIPESIIIISTQKIDVKDSDFLNLDKTSEKSVSGIEGTIYYWMVLAEGYESQSGVVVLTEDMILDVSLEKIEKATLTIIPHPENAKISIEGEVQNSYSTKLGETVSWIVSSPNYITRAGQTVLDEDNKVVEVTLEREQKSLVLNIDPEEESVYLSSITGAIEYPEPTEELKNSIQIKAKYGSTVSYSLEPKDKENFKSTSGSIVMTSNKEVVVSLPRVPKYWGFICKSTINEDSSTRYWYLSRNPKVGDQIYQASFVKYNDSWIDSKGIYQYAYSPADSISDLVASMIPSSSGNIAMTLTSYDEVSGKYFSGISGELELIRSEELDLY